MLTFGSLFAGIGGFDLGLERAGMRCLWQCEIDPYCQRVLARHWPDVLRVRDVRRIVGTSRGILPGDKVCDRLDYVPDVDVICGGFPCQDLSVAGRGAGLAGERSGLWFEYVRVVGELRPRYVIVENVRALAARGLDVVLGTLAEIGYDAEWDCIPASAVGAPHQRDRIWIVAYPQRDELREQSGRRSGPGGPGTPLFAVDGASRSLADAAGDGRGQGRAGRPAGEGEDRADVTPAGMDFAADFTRWWAVEPDVGRVADGVPARVDRLRALGNALVPQIAEWIGRRILEHEGAQR